MGLYKYCNPDDESDVIEIVQSIHEKHVYEKNGVVWNRVWEAPNAAIDSKIDPFSAKEFREKTTNKKETIGSMWSRSGELSEKRKQKEGVDQIKEKYFEGYSKKRRGKPHPEKAKEAANQTFYI